MAEENRVSVELVVTQKGLEIFDQAGKKIGEFASSSTGAAKASGVFKDVLDGITEGFDKEISAAGKAAQQHRNVESSFSSLASKIITLNQAWELAAKAAGLAGSAIQAVFSGIERGGQLDDLSKRLGVSVETLSTLELGAKTAGVSLEGLGTGIQQLSRNMLEAVGGSKEIQESFAALGVSVTDANGNLRSSEEVLLEIADRFAGAQDGAAKTGLAMQLLGRSGAQLIPFLNEGADGLREWGELSRKLGLDLDRGLASSMDSVGDSLEIVKAAFQGAANQVSIGLAPALERLGDEVVDFVANLGIADGGLRTFGEEIGEIFDAIAGGLSNFQQRVEDVGFKDALFEALEQARESVVALAVDIGVNVGKELAKASAEAMKQTYQNMDWDELVGASIGAGLGLAIGLRLKEPITGAAAGLTLGADLIGPIVASIRDIWNTIWETEQVLSPTVIQSNLSRAFEAAAAGDVDLLGGLVGELQKSLEALDLVVDPDVLLESENYGTLAEQIAVVVRMFQELSAARDQADAGMRIAIEHAESYSSLQTTLGTKIGQNADGTHVYAESVGELAARFPEVEQKAKPALDGVSRGLSDAAKEAEQLTKAFEQQASALLTNIDAAEDQNDALQQIIDGNLDAEEAQALLNDALERGAIAQALAKDADQARAETIGLLVRGLAEQQQAQQALNATRQAQEQTNQLQQELAILRQVEAGTKDLATAEREIAVIREKAKGTYDDQAEALVAVQDEVSALRDRLKEVGEESTVIADAFSDFITGIAQGTQELSLDGITDAFRAAFAATIKEKLQFDELFKGNLLDLVGFAADLFSGGTIDVGGLFSLGGGGGGGGGGLLSLLGGGGAGGSALGLLGLLGGGFLAGGGGSLLGGNLGLAGSSLSLLNTGTALLGVGNGTGIIGALLGAGEAGNLGTLLGAEFGGQAAGLIDSLFGAGSGASFLTNTSLSGIFGAAGAATSFVGGGVSAFGLGQGDFSAANILGLVASTAAALNYLPVIGQILYALVVAVAAITGGLIDTTPTEGTLRRRAGESALTSLPTFAGLEETYGDITRTDFRLRNNPDLPDIRERLGADAVTEIAGFAAIFSEAVFGGEDGGKHVANIATEWTNILTSFFGRMEGESEVVAAAIRGHLLSAFKDMGIDEAHEAFERINDVAEALNKNAADPMLPNYFDEAVDHSTLLGTAIRGVASVFESELPKGVHLASLALETMSKDGVSFFGDLDKEGRETLLNLSKDAENFDKVIAHLFEQDFEIDTEEFRRRLEAISASAEFIGANIGVVFDTTSAEAAVQSMLQNLKGAIKEQLGGAFLEQLFDKTQIATVFEPVFDILNRLDEFDLTTPGGLADLRSQIIPAILQGKENLQEYLPVLREMIANWKEIEKIIDEAFEPTAAEEMAATVTQAFDGLGGIFASGIEAGLAILATGGTYQDALDAFNSVVGQGVEATLKQAVFNALINTAVIQPLIEKYAPAFSFVAVAGLENGFGDPQVRAAWLALMEQLGADVEAFGPLIFDAQLELIGQQSAAEQFFINLEAAGVAANRQVAQSLYSLLRESVAVALEDGAEAGKKHFAENIGDVIYDVLLDAIIRAFVDAVLVEGLLGPVITEGAALYAAAVDEESPGGRLITPEEQAGLDEWRSYWADVVDVAIQEAERLTGFLFDNLPTPDDEGGQHNRYTRETQGDYDLGSRDEDRIGTRRAALDAEEDAARRLTIDREEDLADRTLAATNALGDFTDAVQDAIRALAGLDGGTGGGTAPPEDGGRLLPGRGVPGAAMGGHFGSAGAAVVGEAGMPELVTARAGGGFDVTPLSWEEASALMGEGVPGYALGTRRWFTDGPRDRAPGGGGGYYPGGFGPRGGFGPGSGWGGSPFIGPDDARNPANRPRGGDGASADELEVLVSFNYSSVIDDFARGGTEDELKEALRISTGEGVLEGMKEALIESIAFDAFNEKLSNETRKAMSDGVIDATEAAHLADMAEEFAGTAEEAILAMGPAFDVVAQRFGITVTEEVKDGLAIAAETLGSLAGSALRSVFRDPANLSFETFSLALRQEIYGTIVDGLVAAFIDAAVIQGALAPMLSTITEQFKGLGVAIAEGSAEGIATATGIIVAEVGKIAGVINDPAFAEALKPLLDLGPTIAGALGLPMRETTQNLTDLTRGFEGVADAAANACTGECDAERKLVESREKVTRLNELGRVGFETTERWRHVGPTLDGPPPGWFLDPRGGGIVTVKDQSLQDEVASLRADIRYLGDTILNRPMTVELDGRKVNKELREQRRWENRGGATV